MPLGDYKTSNPGLREQIHQTTLAGLTALGNPNISYGQALDKLQEQKAQERYRESVLSQQADALKAQTKQAKVKQTELGRHQKELERLSGERNTLTKTANESRTDYLQRQTDLQEDRVEATKFWQEARVLAAKGWGEPVWDEQLSAYKQINENTGELRVRGKGPSGLDALFAAIFASQGFGGLSGGSDSTNPLAPPGVDPYAP